MKPEPRYKKGDKIGGRYLVHKALIGGMGEVYLCLDLKENLPLALKTFQQRYITDTQRLRRAFEQEVATWVALEKHPNIVRCFMMQTLDHQPFMMLEWIAGEAGKGTDLRSWLRHGPLDLKLALQIAIDVCNGLLHAQAKRPGLVHRDLKPENILMAQGGLAKITDFGLAQIAQTAGLVLTDDGVSSDRAAQEHRQSLIGGQGIAGTPAYMAPEQWRGEPLDVRTDIYALGCILYELLTGACPFAVNVPANMPNRGANWLRSLQHAHEQAAVAPLAGTLPAGLNDLVQRCLAKQPAARHPTVAALHTALLTLYQIHFAQAPWLCPTPATFTAGDYTNRGNTYAALGQQEAALADFTQAISIDPTFVQAYINRGTTYEALGQRETALADYTQAITIDPTFANAYANRGVTYAALGQWDKALADFTQSLTLDPTDTLTYSNRGVTYADLDEYAAALADYTQAITIDPTFTQAYTSRGILYADLGQRDKALADFTQSITLDPTNAKAYSNRGILYNALSKQEAALSDYTQSLTLDPTDAKVYTNRGVIYSALGKREQALADFTRAITLDPTNAKAYTNRGVTYESLDQWEAALADYTQAITLNPTLAQAYTNRGVIYAALGKREQALADFTQAITLDPTDVKVYVNRGVIYSASGQREAALADYTQAITIDPTFAQAYNNRGAIYHRLGQWEAALADFTQTITIDPNYTAAYVNIGALLDNQGQLAEALPYFEHAAHVGDPRGVEYAAQARQRLGIEPTLQVNSTQQAFDVFQQADSLTAMQQAVTRYALLLQPDFITAIEQAITQQVPPEYHPAFTQRLAWLRQIANTQPRSTL